MKSQLEVCGATITTIFGRGGNSPSMRHPSAPNEGAPDDREKALPRLRQGGRAGRGTHRCRSPSWRQAS